MKIKNYIIANTILRTTRKAFSSNSNTSSRPPTTAECKKACGCLFKIVLPFIYLVELLFAAAVPLFGISLIALTIAGQLLFYFSDKQKAKRASRKAHNKFEENDFHGALEFFKEAHRLDCSDYSTIRSLGYTYRLVEEYDDAIEMLQKYLSEYPDDHFALFLLGSCYYDTELFEKAIEVLQLIPESYEKNAKVLNLLGSSFYQLGKVDSALDTFNRAPLNQPIDSYDLKELHYNLGLIYNDLKEEEKALSQFKKVYARDINYRDVEALIESLE
ncbi:MAG: tetratricopeptide repeat protein [Candidatus Krumholzibacteriota bacterium]|nr:tetratricopeptide repeat protein [Candidatus Krumholzibacteriota bacterium]